MTLPTPTPVHFYLFDHKKYVPVPLSDRRESNWHPTIKDWVRFVGNSPLIGRGSRRCN